MVMALAVIHHLAIGKNIPFEKIAYLFHHIGKWLVIEFVPKEDEKVILMLNQKKDIYSDYSETNFINAFSKYYSVERKQLIPGSSRILFLMKSH